jgi:GTP-binding protein
VVNKVDNSKIETQLSDFFGLGLGTPIPISAHHNRGIGSLIDTLLSLIAPVQAEEEVNDIPRVAIVGRPNVGKSMLLNALVGNDRVIVDSVPGTTRDAVDTQFTYGQNKIILIDTAGIRKRGKSGTGIDYYSLIRSLRAINRCDIALLVVDATEPLIAQDMHIAGYIKDAHKGMLLVVNKCDLISKQEQLEIAKSFRQRLKSAPYTPALFVSALEGTRVSKLLPSVMEIWVERHKQLPDPVVDKLIKGAVKANIPPHKGLKRLQVVRAYQDSVNPPGFTFLVNDPGLLHFSYQRYLENKLRQTFGFRGTALRFSFKKASRRGSTGKE